MDIRWSRFCQRTFCLSVSSCRDNETVSPALTLFLVEDLIEIDGLPCPPPTFSGVRTASADFPIIFPALAAAFPTVLAKLRDVLSGEEVNLEIDLVKPEAGPKIEASEGGGRRDSTLQIQTKRQYRLTCLLRLLTTFFHRGQDKIIVS